MRAPFSNWAGYCGTLLPALIVLLSLLSAAPAAAEKRVALVVGNYNGIAIISSGHVSGRSGSGTFRRSDGCVGSWTSPKQ
jgi:hypothetical protein